MTILNTPVPRTDVTHSAAAAFCGIPCVLAKLEHNTPYLLTEHGVYIREQYLSVSKRGYPAFLNTFFIRLIHSIVNLNYHYASQISPVCSYNTRWEERFGVEKDRLQVIYNGVDKNIFSPTFNTAGEKQPTVVTVARIDPVKDIKTLIKAAGLVKREIPSARFMVFGSVSITEYYEECLRLKHELGLDESFIFTGHTSDVASAYGSGDIVVLSSITEAFPFSVVEAMMSGKPVIATDVGGIREAIDDCGLLVPPRNEEALAIGIIKLLKDKELRMTLGKKGRERALGHFTIEEVQNSYYQSYEKLYVQDEQIKQSRDDMAASFAVIARRKQRLMMDKAAALCDLGCYQDGILCYRSAMQEDSKSPAIPFILTRIAEIYNLKGEHDKAFYELEKLEAYLSLVSNNKIS